MYLHVTSRLYIGGLRVAKLARQRPREETIMALAVVGTAAASLENPHPATASAPAPALALIRT